MDVKIYTQNHSIFQNSESVLFKYFEYILLILIAMTGLICSAFAIADNSALPSGGEFRQVSLYTSPQKSDFDKYIKITGDQKSGNVLTFDIKMDIKAKRYVMEMGDGRRMILTASQFTYKYDVPGEYILELKEIQRGLIAVVGEKKLKIKKLN